MKKLVLALAVVACVLLAAEKVDVTTVAKIRSEEMEHSQVMYIEHMLADRHGILDPTSGNVQASFEVGDRPWGIALSPDEKLLFTANGRSNDVSILDVATQKVIKKVKVGDKPWGVLIVGSH